MKLKKTNRLLKSIPLDELFQDLSILKHVLKILTKCSDQERAIIFSNQKKIQYHSILQDARVHLFRLLLSHHLLAQRRLKVKRSLSTRTLSYMEQFERDGILVLNNFFPTKEFNLLRSEALRLEETLKSGLNGSRSVLDRTLNTLGASRIKNTINSPMLNELLQYALGTAHQEFYDNRLSKILIQRLTYLPHYDIQTEVHSDTFQPTFRWWLYLDEVTLNHGPFHYVKGSHINTRERQQWEYQKCQSVIEQIKQRDSSTQVELNYADAEGSFRPLMGEPKYPQNLKLEPITGPANTLILVNTHGFHCRGQVQPKYSRFTLFGYSRLNQLF